MKKIARTVIVVVLGWQVRRLRKRHAFKVVGIVGSIGKTSTKFAVAKVLSEKYRVRFQRGNYNDIVTVPLVFFGRSLPSLFNPFAWAVTIIGNEVAIRRPFRYDVVVVEVGTDTPGDIQRFKKYLSLDIAILTAITPEHMEFFEDLDAVAEEELAVTSYANQLVVNTDLCDQKYLAVDIPLSSYGTNDKADVRITKETFKNQLASFTLVMNGNTWLATSMEAVAKSELYSATAAAAVANLLQVPDEEIINGISKIQPVSGRMQRLQGIKGSWILDETYNASPDAVMAALDSLYLLEADQKIAVLGNMNELGKYSEDAHRSVGQYCDPKQLDLVVTIGPDANTYLAAAAKAKGCSVQEFTNPFDAGMYVKERIKKGAVILVKGSQNNVYAEEAVKPLLKNPKDSDRLVRQSAQWMKKKQRNFQRG